MIYWPLVFAWLATIVLVSLPLTWLMPFRRFQLRLPVPMVARLLWFAGARVEVTHAPGFTPPGPYVYVQNHVSMLDVAVVARVIPGLVCGIENAAHYRVPLYGWLMRQSGGIAVHPKRSGQTAAVLEQARQRVALGFSVLVFPEAHRTLDGKLRTFHRGGFVMARALGLPVVPVAVRGLRKVLPKGTWIVRPGRVEVFIGEPIATKGLSDAALDEVMAQVRATLARWVEGDARGDATA